jgi:hypothetical protein
MATSSPPPCRRPTDLAVRGLRGGITRESRLYLQTLHEREYGRSMSTGSDSRLLSSHPLPVPPALYLS